MRIADALLPEFDHEMPNTRKMLERIPDEKWDWRPHPKSWTTRELATHIAMIPAWMVDTIEKDSFDFAPVGGEPYSPPVFQNKEEALAAFGLSPERKTLLVMGGSQGAHGINEAAIRALPLLKDWPLQPI